MAKTRRKTAATVSRGKDTFHVLVPDEHIHDGSIILGLQDIKSNVIPCTSSSLPSSLSPTTSVLLALLFYLPSRLSSDSKLVDTDTIEYCSI
ncbi:hypothetical protein D5086_001778 [Populus alba]|uniref:Uncharacterized protein n=1 Tax=Populus alba TaxID=43335 RepID=A0ACC4D0X0_POPAL